MSFFIKKGVDFIDIIFSANNNEQVLTLPVLPESMPEFAQSYKNSTFESINGELNLIGTKALQTVSITSFFPNKKYNFIRPKATPDGWVYVAFFNKYANQKMPIRMILLDNEGKEISNMAYTIETFNTYVDKVGDVQYTLDLKEYRFPKVKK